MLLSVKYCCAGLHFAPSQRDGAQQHLCSLHVENSSCTAESLQTVKQWLPLATCLVELSAKVSSCVQISGFFGRQKQSRARLARPFLCWASLVEGSAYL